MISSVFVERKVYLVVYLADDKTEIMDPYLYRRNNLLCIILHLDASNPSLLKHYSFVVPIVVISSKIRMQRLRLYDVPGGDTVLYDIMDESNGYRQSTFFMPEDVHYENFHNIKHVKCRDDDIFLNSYPKTGLSISRKFFSIVWYLE